MFVRDSWTTRYRAFSASGEVRKPGVSQIRLTRSRMRLEMPDGTVNHAELEPGRSYFRSAGVSHNVINEGDGDLIFVEVEFLKPATARR